MTSSNNKHKLKAFWLLFIVGILCFTLFFIGACGDDTTKDDDDTTYTKVETDSSDIVNGTFEFGSADIKLTEYPQTSMNGWSRASTDSSVTSSIVNSGIVDTKTENWKSIMLNLYDNENFIKVIEKKFSVSIADITTAKKSEFPEKTDDEIKEVVKEYVFDTYLKNLNPSTHDGAKGSKVLMLNNYTTNDFYTSQKITSSSSVSLKKGSYAKISFWIYTQGVSGYGDYLANVRIADTFNSSSQSDYILKNISAANEWKQYTVYLKADDFFSSSVTVSLALGYSATKENYSECCQGTVYFDDVMYEEVTKEEYDGNVASKISSANTKVFSYNNKAVITQDAALSTDNVYLYVTDVAATAEYASYLSQYDVSAVSGKTYEYTKSNNGNVTSSTKFGADSDKGSVTYENGKFTVSNLKYASVALTLSDGTWAISPSEYLLLNFKIKNELNALGSTAITVYVKDEDNNYKTVGTYTKGDEDERVSIKIVNNYPDKPAGNPDKTFSLLFVIGPTDVKNSENMYDYASGSVTVYDVTVGTGLTYQYEKESDGNKKLPEEETANYKLFSLYNSVATSISIDDYTQDTTDTYVLSAAKSEIGNIVNFPVAIDGYYGVGYDSIHLNKESENKSINERTNQGKDGNFAGLVNSNYVNGGNYDVILSGLKTALSYDSEKSIQPIMIYNNVADAYGFIGESFTISASSYAKISVKVKATGDAKANVYLVDASDVDKNVATFGFEKGNVAGNANYYNEKFSAPLSFEGITSELCENAGGWLTVTFYVATGDASKTLRLELWNGSRNGQTKSQGYVFFSFDAFTSQETFTSSVLAEAFTEPTSYSTAFTTEGNPLYTCAFDLSCVEIKDSAVLYKRELDSTEIKFNGEYPDEKISYTENYVWAKAFTSECSAIYAVYNTVDPVAVDPYENHNEETTGGCATQSDPATFWLSFSSILLGVVLVLAIIALIVKHYHNKRKANKNDAKTHYDVSSRYKATKTAKKKKTEKAVKNDVDDYEENENSVPENKADNNSTETESDTTENIQENNDEYVYGEVQDFGSDVETPEKNDKE